MGQVLCCLDEKRRFYNERRGLSDPPKYDDDEEEGGGISLRKDDLRLNGSSHNHGGLSEVQSNSNDIFAIDKRPH